MSGISACTVPTSQTLIESPQLRQVTASATVPPAPTATETVVPSATLFPSLTPLPPTITPTPINLAAFLPGGLTYGVQPTGYIKDTCQYLYQRWNAANSVPGTVVVPVMFHSISDRGTPTPGDTTITTAYFNNFMEKAAQLGFQTITTAQLAAFLERNAYIPPRSMILIVDDRKRAQFFKTFFEPYYKKYGWTVTNAWISHPDTPAYLWNENASLIPDGYLDFQAHGVIHNIPIEADSSDDFIHTEIFGPLTAMQQHFGKQPIGFIWPRGLFTTKAVGVARQAGYQLGFTSYPRGPLLFNWIPLGKDELQANDPLMVLPRYWDVTASASLDEALKISAAARDFASRYGPTEKSYYRQYCDEFPEIK